MEFETSSVWLLASTYLYSAPRCQILMLKCTKFDYYWGSAPDPAGEAYSAPPDTLASKRMEEEGECVGEGERRGRKGIEEGPVKSVKPRARKVASPSAPVYRVREYHSQKMLEI